MQKRFKDMRQKRKILFNPSFDDIKLVAKKMAAQGGVKSVILFGSRARGDHNEMSDVDLLVITSDSSKDPIMESVRIELGLDVVMSCDMVAIHEKEWHSLQNEPYSVYKKAKEEGVVLYGKKITKQKQELI